MSCTFSQELIEQAIAFHGHYCPGLGIGLRATEYALYELKATRDTDMLAVVETDMCAVDAIQFLTSCTFGKGNLIHKDYGKTAFSFYNRETGESIRLVFNHNARGASLNDLMPLMKKVEEGTATEEEHHHIQTNRESMKERFFQLPLQEMFSVKKAESLPRPARILASIACEQCGERVMESRIRRFGGKYMCIPCFMKIEQKI